MASRALLRPLAVGNLTRSISLMSACQKHHLRTLTWRTTIPQISALSQRKRNYGSIYEPEYLDATVQEIPLYDLLNLQLKGYDFPVLEKYAKYVHHTAERIGISVEEAWPQPCKKLRVTKLKPESSAVDCEYFLNLYERNVQLSDVPSTLLPVLINVIEAALPAGVTLRVHPHIPEHTEKRYVPDLELKQLRSQLEDMKTRKD